MRYGVIGARELNHSVYDNYKYIAQILSGYKPITELVTGGSRGVENLAETWAKDNNISNQIILPNIKVHGTSEAFIHRNLQIIRSCDILLLFWDGVNNIPTSPLTFAAQLFKIAHVIPIR